MEWMPSVAAIGLRPPRVVQLTSLQEEALANAFALFDANRTGLIEADELATVLQVYCSRTLISHLLLHPKTEVNER